MPIFRIFQKTATSLPLLFLLLAWHTTITKIKEPEFAIPIDSLQGNLNGLVVCEHITLDGREATTNRKVNAQLEIDILNGKDIDEDDGRMKILAHSIAAQVKDALKNKNEYDNYTVLFVKIESSAGVTRRAWKGREFKSSEL